MSRIGKLPINVPAGVTVTIAEGNVVTVKGPKGELTQALSSEMKISQEDGVVKVERPSDAKNHRALHGLTRTLLNNMVVGVTEGYQKNLEIVGTGYRAVKDGKKMTLTIGYSHPVVFEDGDGLTIECPTPNKITVKGIDKQKVGQLAAVIRAVRKPEPYLGKGIKYDNEVILRKAGKTGAKK